MGRVMATTQGASTVYAEQAMKLQGTHMATATACGRSASQQMRSSCLGSALQAAHSLCWQHSVKHARKIPRRAATVSPQHLLVN